MEIEPNCSSIFIPMIICHSTSSRKGVFSTFQLLDLTIEEFTVKFLEIETEL